MAPGVDNIVVDGSTRNDFVVFTCRYYVKESLVLNDTNFVSQGAIQVLRNADGVRGCQIFQKKALRRCKVQCY